MPARIRSLLALAAFAVTAVTTTTAAGGAYSFTGLKSGTYVLTETQPTAYLDARNARRVAGHLFEDAGHRLVLVTHDLALAERCDAAVLFAGGRIVAVGAPSDVIAEYEAILRC